MNKKLTTTYILSQLSERDVDAFETDEFRRLFALSPERTHAVLHRLTSVGVLHRLGRGRYVVVGLGRGEVLGHPFFLATRLLEPSYVSFWSALHFYGWTEQVPRTVFLANTRLSGLRRIASYRIRLVRLARNRFFAYTAARQGDFAFPVAEPEKAIVDAIYLPQYAGGMGLVAEALVEAVEILDGERLAAYAATMGVRSLCSRLGYLLRGLGTQVRGLKGCASRSYVKVDPSASRRGRFDAEWHVIDNLRGGP